ncbi:hypothetical protein GLW07_14170 [Bacillus hwajinpoensis]|uniref:Uncharacterized protein n=1 Tax=Guptibacillus hwajinpoensis TaxID=208199 RepID=A0A845F124_9BACL|nr:hypothetical protein [Pseudalkalibacillus hwajinpoensis]MYL64500.1 hypothetical protein [Pseudalkalibacillus hwajinpoensis]
MNEALPDAGRNVPEYGLQFKVTGKATDLSVGRVSISRNEFSQKATLIKSVPFFWFEAPDFF